MKKTFSKPSIEELDFRDTAYCGSKSLQVKYTSGPRLSSVSTKCYSLNNWLLGGWNTPFAGEESDSYEEE